MEGMLSERCSPGSRKNGMTQSEGCKMVSPTKERIASIFLLRLNLFVSIFKLPFAFFLD
jgi:hypothetical protein